LTALNDETLPVAAEKAAALEEPRQQIRSRPGPLRRLYDWTIHWAQTRYAPWVLAGVSFAEASFFPIPPDVLLIPMGLARPRRALRYALLCTLASVLGGCLGYGIGALAFEAIGKPVLSFYNVLDKFDSVTMTFTDHGGIYVFVAALTPIPFKVFTISAGVCHARIPLGVLVLAATLGRGLRFFTLGVLIKYFGNPAKRFIDRYFNLLTILFLLLLALGFLCVRILGGCGDARVSAPAAPVPQETRNVGGKTMLSEEARNILLTIARQSVEAALKGKSPPPFNVENPQLQHEQGAFVTLRTNGRLRGCIGQFIAEEPLWQVVQAMAVSAATRDPRFFGNRLSPKEMDRLRIEISVLSPLKRINDPMTEMELGKDGIYIRRGMSSGCFLPQVADETGWSKEEFLSQCCAMKAGLAPDAWKEPDTEIFIFTAEVFEEKEK